MRLLRTNCTITPNMKDHSNGNNCIYVPDGSQSGVPLRSWWASAHGIRIRKGSWTSNLEIKLSKGRVDVGKQYVHWQGNLGGARASQKQVGANWSPSQGQIPLSHTRHSEGTISGTSWDISISKARLDKLCSILVHIFTIRLVSSSILENQKGKDQTSAVWRRNWKEIQTTRKTGVPKIAILTLIFSCGWNTWG